LAAARRFFKQAIGANSVLDGVVNDKSSANLIGLMAMNVVLKLNGTGRIVTTRQLKHVNNILKKDHCFIRRHTTRQ